MVDVQPKDMSHLRKRSETTLGCATADRAVADGPNSAAVSRQPGRGNGRVLLDSWNIVCEVALRRGNVPKSLKNPQRSAP